jgi:hypothetical protein
MWCEVRTSGKRHPVNAEPDPAGSWQVVGHKPDGTPLIILPRTTDPELFAADDGARYVTHFSTCPDADRHRRR